MTRRFPNTPAEDRSGAPTDLSLIAPDGTGGRQLTRDRDFERSPSWSPDGSRIAFFRFSAEGGRTTLRVVDERGRTVADVAVPPPADRGGPPAWTPDGSRLVLVTRGGLQVVRLAGRRVTRLVAPPAARGLTSRADWARVVFVRPGGIHVAGADGRAIRRLTGRRGDAGPAWSPDGSRIAFTRGRRIWLMDADGRRDRALPTATTLGRTVSWSPDGTRIVASDRGSVSVVEIASGRRTQLTRSTLDLAPAWSPDATRLVFQSYGVLWRANADGTGLARVLGDNTSPAEGWNERPSWGP